MNEPRHVVIVGGRVIGLSIDRYGSCPLNSLASSWLRLMTSRRGNRR